jgi:hypothetical protein
MDKYDRNILDRFKYYNREYRLLGATRKGSEDTAQCETQPETRRNSNHSEDLEMFTEDLQAIMDTNKIILNSTFNFDDVRTVGLIGDLLVKGSKYVNMERVSDDLKIVENTLGMFSRRVSEILSSKVSWFPDSVL